MVHDVSDADSHFGVQLADSRPVPLCPLRPRVRDGERPARGAADDALSGPGVARARGRPAARPPNFSQPYLRHLRHFSLLIFRHASPVHPSRPILFLVCTRSSPPSPHPSPHPSPLPTSLPTRRVVDRVDRVVVRVDRVVVRVNRVVHRVVHRESHL